MTEYVIDQYSSKDLLARFYDFGDSVIEDIQVSFGDSDEDCVITIVGQSIDEIAVSAKKSWYVKTTFTISDLLEFKIDYETSYNLVVISELKIVTSGDLLYLDFYGSRGYTLEAIRKSRLYFVCRSCVLKVEPLDDE